MITGKGFEKAERLAATMDMTLERSTDTFGGRCHRVIDLYNKDGLCIDCVLDEYKTPLYALMNMIKRYL